MPRAIVLLLAMAACSSIQAGELDGHYRATLDGQPSELILRQSDSVVEGEYVESQRLRLIVKGHYDGKLLRAEISDPQTGLLLANMNATYANAMLNTSIAARDPANAWALAIYGSHGEFVEPGPLGYGLLLLGVGVLSYLAAGVIFHRRDLPAPL